MRDKDAHLIFESYRNRVILNENPALAIPAAGMGLAEILGLAATALGATGLAAAIDSKSNEISRMISPSAKSKSTTEEIASIIQSSSFNSIQNQYKALNLAKSLNVPAASELIKMSENVLEMEKTLEEGTLDADQSSDYINSILFSIEEQAQMLSILARKTQSEPLIKLIETLVKHVLSENKELKKQNKKGGGKEPDKEPDKDPKDYLKWIKYVFNLIKSKSAWINVGIILICYYIAYGALYGSEELGKKLRKDAESTAGTIGGLGKGFFEKPKAQPSPTPIQGEFPTTGTWTPRKKIKPALKTQERPPKEKEEEKTKSKFDYENFIK